MRWLWEERSCKVKTKDISFILPGYLGGKCDHLFIWGGKMMKKGC